MTAWSNLIWFMFRYHFLRSTGNISCVSKFNYLTLYMNDRQMSREIQFSFNGMRLDFSFVWNNYWAGCSTLSYVHNRIGKVFQREIIMFGDQNLPLLDRKKQIFPCLNIMLVFASVQKMFGSNALLKSCDVILRKWEHLYGLMYWGTDFVLGTCNYLAMEHYFREAMDIPYVQSIRQWSEDI